MNAFEHFCEDTSTTLIITHHFAKGNVSKKNTIDRMSGSGVFARDPDTVIQLTPHEDENTLVVSPILRDHKEMPDFGIYWKYPLLVRDNSINTKKIFNNGKKKVEFDRIDIIKEIAKAGAGLTVKNMADVLGCSTKTIRQKLDADNVLFIATPAHFANGKGLVTVYTLSDKGKDAAKIYGFTN
jgi:hypothetical protein